MGGLSSLFGGFSGGGAFNKSAQNTTTSTTNSLGLNFSEVGSVAAPTGDNANITLTDAGAIAASYGFGETVALDSLDFANRNALAAYDFAGMASRDSFGLASDVAARSVGIASEVASKSVSDAGDVIADLSKWIIGGLVVVGVSFMLKKKRAG